MTKTTTTAAVPMGPSTGTAARRRKSPRVSVGLTYFDDGLSVRLLSAFSRSALSFGLAPSLPSGLIGGSLGAARFREQLRPFSAEGQRHFFLQFLAQVRKGLP